MPEFSFQLKEDFLEQYKNVTPPFGFKDAGGNSLGELVFIRTYSRVKPDGTKEKWWEVCERVINGMYSIQKDHAKANRLPWSDPKAAASAKEAYDRMFGLKWTPPGRGLWTTGTDLIHERGIVAGLYNCSFVSTGDMERHDPGAVFAWVMDALMLGVGVGFDTRGADKNILISKREDSDEVYVIPDTREGWAESVRLLINSYLRTNKKIDFDYSLIRAYGEPIKGFGGTSSGPDPLIKVHKQISSILDAREGEAFDSRAIVDMVNLIGTCVVAGNVRRSATIALGDQNDTNFLELKNYEKYPERAEWGWLSNNTVVIDKEYDYAAAASRITDNGEPGFLWLDTMQNYGRLKDAPDGKDHRVLGTNPCAEISLESYELCVSGDTRIQTKTGLPKIKDVVGVPVDVWNGKRWSQVIPFETGINQIYRVTLSDGTYLDATPGHNWNIDGKKFRTDELKPGMRLPRFSLSNINGINEVNAYEHGWFAGDGYIDKKNVMALVQESEYSVLETVSTKTVYKEQHPSGYSRPFKRINLSHVIDMDEAISLRNGVLPERMFSWDSLSILDFVAGLIDTDGTITNKGGSEGYRIYAKEQLARDLVVLLRRTGINHATASVFADKGDITNYGKRNQALWYVTIPTFEAGVIPTRIKIAKNFGSKYKKNNAHVQSKPVDASRRQKIVSVEKISDAEQTYCFNEPETGMGVFGNALTYQCNLVELHLNRHDSMEDYLRTIKFAYLYAKSITLLPTHWKQTNAVIQRNRRIGTSMTGIAGFVDKHGLPAFRQWADAGYAEIQGYDKAYSEWLGIRESIRTTTVKPSGSVSLLSGATPGVHWPAGGKFYKRAIRFGANDPMLPLFRYANYDIEPDLYSDNTFVVYFPVKTDMERSEKDVSIYEKIHLAAEAQRFWSDNSVSVTVTFDPKEEQNDIARVLKMHEGELKTVSFLPMSNDVYPQQPYTEIDEESYNAYTDKIMKIDFNAVYDGVENLEAEGEKYCTTDTCMI